MDMKPIETRYKGYRFRSRLEARWAVFFDALEMPWEYEKQGFLAEDGTTYLPDFFLPNQNLWVEVKPKDQIDFDPEGYAKGMVKIAWFCVIPGSRKFSRNLVICMGNPWPGQYELIGNLMNMPLDGSVKGVWAIDRRDDRSLWIADADPDGAGAWQLNRASEDHDRQPLTDHPLLQRAYEAARSARFEHGESGAG